MAGAFSNQCASWHAQVWESVVILPHRSMMHARRFASRRQQTQEQAVFCQEFLAGLAYRYWDESTNPAYKLFLG
jgi:hypothetical protein